MVQIVIKYQPIDYSKINYVWKMKMKKKEENLYIHIILRYFNGNF